MIKEPAEERLGRPYIVLVVPGDGCKEVGIAAGHVSVVVDDGSRTPFDVSLSLVAGQDLKRLQAVGLHPHLEGVGGHHHQIDEEAGVTQVGEQGLAGRPSVMAASAERSVWL